MRNRRGDDLRHNHEEHQHRREEHERNGRGGASKRFFGRGGVKYALLQLLVDQPMHGYQMMKAMEEKSGGLYIPSPGSIYPTLQRLEDHQLVSFQEQEGKKVYRITEAGAQFLKTREEEIAESHRDNLEHREHRDNGDHRCFKGWKHPGTESGMLVRAIADAELDCWDHPERMAGLNELFSQQRRALTDYMEQFHPAPSPQKKE